MHWKKLYFSSVVCCKNCGYLVSQSFWLTPYHVSAVTTQLPGERGYTGGKVIYIDTENTLYPCQRTGL